MGKVHEQSLPHKRTRAHLRLNLTGQRFGRWLVLRMGFDGRETLAWCRCDCGTEGWRKATSIGNGQTRSCGCGQTRRGQAREHHRRSHSATYSAWNGMRRRCEVASCTEYHRYGGRGIYVCERWQTFSCFVDDLGERPDPGMSLDRIDPDFSYTCGKCRQCIAVAAPANVRWANAVEQARNRRNAIRVVWQGQTRLLVEWVAALGLNYQTTYMRLVQHGWTPEQAFTVPAVRGNNQTTRL